MPVANAYSNKRSTPAVSPSIAFRHIRRYTIIRTSSGYRPPFFADNFKRPFIRSFVDMALHAIFPQQEFPQCPFRHLFTLSP